MSAGWIAFCIIMSYILLLCFIVYVGINLKTNKVMKELTIEEKAKRYDEAYKVAKNIHIFSSDLAEIKRMEEIFPELKEESEDERVRKRICKLLWDNAPYEEAQEYIAWLEKQNKQKPVFEMKTPEESLGIDSETYNKIVDECIYGEQKLANKIEPKDYSSIDPHFAKPIDKVEPKFKIGDNIEPIDSRLGSPRTIYNICDGFYETNQGTLYFEFESNWRLIEQKSACSEEDEVKINRIVACLENLNVADNDILLKDVDWLKSLRPQSQWKPSDEQIRELSIVSTGKGWFSKEILRELLEQLKKLREE